MHRLRTAWTEIDDRETTLPEYYPRLGLDPYPPCIRAAVKQRLVHPFSNRAQFVGAGRRTPIDHPRNAAHVSDRLLSKVLCCIARSAEGRGCWLARKSLV